MASSTEPVVLHIFSGPKNNLCSQCVRCEKLRTQHANDNKFRIMPSGDLKFHLTHHARDRDNHVKVCEQDYLNCECGAPSLTPKDCKAKDCENLLNDVVFNRLVRWSRAGRFLTIIAGIPCNSYSKARFKGELHFQGDGGVPAIRDRDHRLGLPGLPDGLRRSLALNNELTRRSLILCASVWAAGGEVLIENPPDYADDQGLWTTNPYTGERGVKGEQGGAGDRWRQLERQHCPLWKCPWMVAFIKATGGGALLDFAQCIFDADFQKYTSLYVTPHWREAAPQAFSRFDGHPCRCKQPHKRQATGRREDGSYESEDAATYPREMNITLANAVHEMLDRRREMVSFGTMIGATREPLPPPDAAEKERRAAAIEPFLAMVHTVEATRACDPHFAGEAAADAGHGGQRTMESFMKRPRLG